MCAEPESLRSLAYAVAAEANAGVGRHLAKRAAALVLQVGLVNMRIADAAVQVHGGNGYIWETEVNQLYRAAKPWQIGAGTNEVRRLIVGRELLGRSACCSSGSWSPPAERSRSA